MIAFKDKWKDPSTPQTWTIGCLTLLMDADEIHRKQQDMDLAKNQCQILTPTDRALFERLVTYKHLEQNIFTSLTAQVPWIPEKTIAPVGPLGTCRECQYPRSVTILGADGKFGLCLAEYIDEKQKELYINTGVSKDATATSNATWAECISSSCRAQHVIYSPSGLHHPAECHFCRSQGSRDTSQDLVKQNKSPAPTVQCNRCLNCIFWPEKYRTSAFNESDFICPPCTSGCGPTTELQVRPHDLSTENTYSWLIEGENYPRERPFLRESIFQIISRTDIEGYLSKVTPFPSFEPQLRYNGKPILNSEEVISTLQKLVENRKTIDRKCSLCFSIFGYTGLRPACGREGCVQQMCITCLIGWYQHNSAGCVINIRVLECPFCRRWPIPRLAVAYRLDIHAVKGLANAVRDKGKFIYAWCRECDTAKVVMEQSCTRGEPLQLTDWVCGECSEEIESGERVGESRLGMDT